MTTPVRSPCVSICALDENDVCVGCYRSGEEISRWGRYSDDERRAVLQKVAAREQDAMNFTPVKAD
ncbi:MULTISPECIES: DUF1289 domain-containing protein [Oceanospirillaceae]|uniref:DUF1289 domain-containing protein n=1 Tax=Thalassolituus hydrocarboniclasticus TaxID=2742796 RepID=A0ABY6AAK8_9GAMM|nr:MULTISPECIES: DUF1289 domain-containing protein [Thalassolituus]MAY15871.1 DUF1289 domain-containing protein [Oceanospirillaceae bacterium]MBU2037681.1 DUF1289 domain-containing protein [Gammaproteobacteria bacterium]MCA6059831.1 DUF1289 domain-containing protein [Thalassolituus sp. ST750PaO-4]PIQ39244.1 MAG: DUF1289 domain-containing protein [Thalassolituus sp. CG17_big_fil_post_rev_8_21_14_2_50_53_8]MCB2387363.1 DUF1289 domain-containing protein [Thalassolituus alkanivorans]